MDIFAHFFWSLGIFFRQPRNWLFGLIGVLPDLISFGPHFVYSLFNGFRFGKPTNIPDYIYALYNFTHSLVIFIIIFAFILIKSCFAL